MTKRKQSMIIGGLISSAGIFISKFLGLLYVIPFNEMLGGGLNNAYYSQAYNLYSYILNIATAGLPFAIAILISRYSSREDYETCLLVKRISFRLMASFGFVCMLFMIVFAVPIAEMIVPDEGSLTVMRNVIIIISLAIFIIPILSSLRGFYQGLKELEIYSFSQVLEQLVRIIFLLTAGAIAIYIFNLDAIWAVYFGVFAASVSGLLTIIYIKSYDKTKLKRIKTLAAKQEFHTNISKGEIIKELIFVAFPFLLSAIFGYADTIINQFHLISGLHEYGIKNDIALYQDAIFYKSAKIIAIPMILAPGFSSAIIPYLTSALEKKNKKLASKYISECIEIILYIAIPICLVIFLYPHAVTYTLFGGSGKALEIDTYVLHWFAIEAFFSTACPILSSLVISIGKRRQVIITTGIFALIKLVINQPLISAFGIPGMIYSSVIAYLVLATASIMLIQKDFHINWTFTLRKIVFMFIGTIGFVICYYIFNLLGMVNYTGSRLISLLNLGCMGLVSCFVYFGITYFLQIPQSIFHTDLKSILAKFRK